MLTFVWDRYSFYVVDLKDDGVRFNDSHYFCPRITNHMLRNYVSSTGEKQVLVHIQNASAHCAKASEEFIKDKKMIAVPQPPDSTKLVPCASCMFGALKGRIG
jgi:hypothetical protein